MGMFSWPLLTNLAFKRGLGFLKWRGLRKMATLVGRPRQRHSSSSQSQPPLFVQDWKGTWVLRSWAVPTLCPLPPALWWRRRGGDEQRHSSSQWMEEEGRETNREKETGVAWVHKETPPPITASLFVQEGGGAWVGSLSPSLPRLLLPVPVQPSEKEHVSLSSRLSLPTKKDSSSFGEGREWVLIVDLTILVHQEVNRCHNIRPASHHTPQRLSYRYWIIKILKTKL